ncbi:hydroxypyruvate isomerase family protein [Amycolatopsis sp. FDAARGOS 1241]|uniref:hydroxypyruvate isomerase family protein n=1 Tax=Amycolatopsis sp. FDAARGOS 1241 TaxID=2778070 RepID=UPI00194FEF90|nr:TIM barrel protein [Amycolatopsis sp. FDAARGOS 1241]QRP43617.1 TIM barrel protein [Amycolatopsis sp. FDAARGOS 1241]
MTDEGKLKLVANVSLLFAEVPYLERIARAAEAGFTAVETWWPWPEAVPAAAEVDAFVRALDEAGVALAGLNLFAGDMPGGERGIVSNPARRKEFEANLDLVAAIAERTGCPAFNALYGQRSPGGDPAREDAVAREQLAAAVGKLTGTVLVEPLGRGLNGAYPLETARDGVRVVEQVRADTGARNIGLLFDTFHLTTSGEDLTKVVDEYADFVAHVQIADAPGRGEPGTGQVDVAGVVERLWQSGYRGRVACEYKPTVPTEESLAWLSGVPRLGW